MKNIALKNLHWSDFGWKGFHWNKKTWIPAVLLILLAVGGVTAYRLYTQSKAETATSATSTLQTATARLGSLTVSASAAGKVIAATEISIGFDESGTLSELLVKEGDEVQAGQVLARLETDQTEEEIALALAEAQLNVLTAQQALDDIYSTAQVNAAQALKDVEDAEQALEDLQSSDLSIAEAAQAVADAQEALKTAQRSYNSARSTADKNTIAEAYAELVIAKADLKEMQDKFDDYYKKPDDDLEKAAVQLRLSAAQSAYDTALSYYNAVTGTGSELVLAQTEADLAAAQATLADAQRAYERVKNGPSAGEIALAEANLEAAKAKYAALKDGPDPAEIEKAEATLASAKAKLAVAQEDQAVIELTAPQDGTILSIDSAVGQEIDAGPIITLADLSHPLLEIYLDETDLDMVAVGYEADVVFDALPDDTYVGHVTQMSPSLETVSNVATVVARVQLDSDSYAKPLSLPVGSNATVDVIAGRAENTVLVPVEALREISSGEYAVFVMENGEPTLRQVKVGLMDYTYAEITSGIEAGETVTTGEVETKQSDTTTTNSPSSEQMPPPGDMMFPQ
jgi:RND family efflux transporter MFP subunit